MTLQELRQQALQLPISDRWVLVQSLLNSLQQETQITGNSNQNLIPANSLVPWIRSLMGVIHLDDANIEESYIDYLEDKYS